MTEAEVLQQVEDAIDALEADAGKFFERARGAVNQTIRGRKVTLSFARVWQVADGNVTMRLHWSPD